MLVIDSRNLQFMLWKGDSIGLLLIFKEAQIMGWIFALIFTAVGLIVKEPLILIAAGLFAIAGSIDFKDIKK